MFRFGLTSDQISSDEVRQALSLRNGSKKEIVQHQIQLAMKEFQRRPGDTGSTPVQVAILCIKIDALKEHLKMNPKDVHSKRGFDGLMSKRRKLLKYLERKDFDSYRETVLALDLVKKK
ncbi:hypothetical protein ScalyP_jg6786 [Parmales sp. scaly parma]|nr:hypothetical protein ScalyP_jg6786 [Parmales sp. scaly parma]|tara:strand:- start:407 stop:763 length:357 start_codon:yes stop_codon:yes gene_type:complete